MSDLAITYIFEKSIMPVFAFLMKMPLTIPVDFGSIVLLPEPTILHLHSKDFQIK